MKSILEAIRNHSFEQPDKLCIADYGIREYSYGEYWQLIQGFAAYLKKKGLNKGECIVIQAIQSALFTAAEGGIQLAGGISVPVEKDAAEEKIDEIVKTTNAKFLIGTNAVLLNSDIFLNIHDIAEYIQQTKGDTDKVILPESDDIAEILFTTGTTGDAKGVMISHSNNVAVAENIVYGVKMKPDNIELIPVPINHSYGLRSYYANMLNGSTVILIDGIAFLKNFFEAIDKHRVTSLALVPSAISMILKFSKNYISNYAEQIDYVQSGTAILSEDIKEALCRLLPNSRLYNFYGSTESGRCCIIDYSKEKGKPFCIGKPAYNAYFRIVDNEGNTIKSTREKIGHLACFGKMNMVGYWKDPELTSRMNVDGYILTNDLCFIEDGYIYYVGRQGDIINVGGNKVIPAEVEEAASKVECISDCVCIPAVDKFMGQVPKLLVVVKEGFEFDKQSIYDYLLKNLESFKVPKIIEQIGEIPRMYNGKIDRKALL